MKCLKKIDTFIKNFPGFSFQISQPVLHKTSGMPFGAWFNDMGDSSVSKVFFMDFQVVPSCEEFLLYCNLNGVQRNCSDLFKIRSSLDGICCTIEIEKVKQLIE